MSIRSYIAMVYALVAVLVFGLALPGGAVQADRLGCAQDHKPAAITAHVTGDTAEVEIDDNWLGWLMWEPAVYEVPEDAATEATELISCGAGAPNGGASRLTLTVAATGDLNTLTLPVVDTHMHPAEAYLIDQIAEDEDLPAYISPRSGLHGTLPEPLWVRIDTGGGEIEIWSDTHMIDVVALGSTRIVTLAADADLTDPVFVLRYRVTTDAPLLTASKAQGI